MLELHPFLIILMYLDLNYFNKNLQKKIIAIYPKIEETDLKIDVRPSLRIKNLTIILLLNSLLYFALILTKSKEQTLEEIISFIVLSLFFSLLFGFVEYVCCIHCKPDIIVEPVQVFEYKHQGKSLISIKNLDQEYRQLVDNINEKALGYIYLDENDEFELKLIHLKSKLNTYNSKFENITLESIFITGLVLSAFFTISPPCFLTRSENS